MLWYLLFATCLAVLLFPFRLTLLVRWGSLAHWELSFWSKRLAGGRLRDLSFPGGARKPKDAAKESTPKPKAKPKKPFSLRRTALRLWRDRADLWTLMGFSNRSTARLLDALTQRFVVVLGGLDPLDQGWLSVAEAVRQGGGWLRKVKILNDWAPDAQGGAVRWDLGFCLAELVWCGMRMLFDAPWKVIVRAWRTPSREKHKVA
jgi:hypothetical protein